MAVNENPTDAKEQVELAEKYAAETDAAGGNGFAPDAEKSFYWYHRSAEQGYGVGIFNVCVCYWWGRGTPKDKKKARHWAGKMLEPLMAEAAGGDLKAMSALARTFECGYFGFQEDKNTAAHWNRKRLVGYEAAATLGDTDAMVELDRLYMGCSGVPEDSEKRTFWRNKAAELGNALAQFHIGYYYTFGDFKNKALADYWYAKAAEQGNVGAIKVLMEQGTIKILADQGTGWAKKILEEYKPPESGGCSGCYVATCVYGSYECPEVLVLRRYRDGVLNRSWLGRRFIRLYYAVSPKLVEIFGGSKWFTGLWRPVLDRVVLFLTEHQQHIEIRKT